jgi:type VI secretion system protein ImpL
VISSLLGRLFGCLRSRALWVTIGLIALFLIIWYAGPLFAFGEARPLESVSARCCLIGLILAYVLLRLLIARWRAGRMNERVAGMLRSALSAGQGGNKDTNAILSDRFAEALDILRKARFEKSQPSFWGRIARQGKYVYELPWYVIIGAPGVGKTTALLNSGLSFPLAKQIGAASIRGTGGTRHCDWWFTNEAVFIDTAGRYTTHETDAQADKAEWLGFLSLLKKNRARQPINGVLVMLSVSELLNLDEAGRKTHAATLRRRLDELRSDLGTSFPVYILINKCDLLLGFDEYFSALDRSGRAQVWGHTLPLAPSGKYEFDPETLDSELDQLQGRIVAGLVDTLQAESDLARRELIYAFPQQFSVLTQVLREMNAALFAASRFSASPFLRGIYFTSATQEGTPFDRVVHALGQGFEVPRPQKAALAGEGKAYFLQELLSQVVFTEAHIVGLDRRAERRSYAWHVGGYLLSVLGLCGAALAWTVSYRNNLSHIAEVDRKTAEFEQRVLPALPLENNANIDETLLRVLNVAESLPDSAFFKVDEPSLEWRFGLYQGRKLEVGANLFYRKLLAKRFIPTLKAGLEQSLRGVDTGDMELSYEILKAYLMMHDPEHFEETGFTEFTGWLWKDKELYEGALTRHIESAIDMNVFVPASRIDEALVKSARARLTQYTTAQRAYHRLVRQLQNNRLPEFSVASEVGTQAGQVFRLKSERPLTEGIPSLYTWRGYHELFKPKIENVLDFIGKDESWILGVTGSNGRDTVRDIASGRLTNEVKLQYVAEYISYWEKYIDDLDVIAPGNLREALQIVDQLSGVDSPLRRFMLGAARETTLMKEAPKDAQPPSMIDRARNTVNSTANELRGIAPAGTLDSLAPKDIPEMKVNNRFAALRDFVNGSSGDGTNAPMLQAMKRLEDLKMLLADALYRADNRMPMPETGLVTQLENSPGNVPEPFRKMLKKLAGSGGAAIKKADKNIVTTTLNKDVTTFCRKSIAGRYPFNRSSVVGVTPADFADVFGTSGRMERFRQQQRPGIQLPVAFEQARVIREVFFRNGESPQITFTIRPLEMDPTITILNLNIGGQTIRYDHGPSVPTTVTWPASGGSQARVALLPIAVNGVNDVSESGLWALHQLFSKYGEMRQSADAYKVVLTIGGRKAAFELRPTSVRNPFNLPELNQFKCPQGMP